MLAHGLIVLFDIASRNKGLWRLSYDTALGDTRSIRRGCTCVPGRPDQAWGRNASLAGRNLRQTRRPQQRRSDIRMPWTARDMASAGRFWPEGPLGTFRLSIGQQ